MKGVFITGATGNVGSRLVQEYLLHSDHKVFALVRGDSQAHAEKRLQEVLKFWGCPWDRYRDRLVVLRGDVLEPDLGLAPGQIQALDGQVDLFVHAASNIRLDLTVEEARRTILGATRNAWALSRRWPGLERFGFVSTLEVVGKHRGVVREEFLTDRRPGFLNTYEQAKFEAEEFLKRQIDQGGAITVFRPSMVVGESGTGKALEFQSFYLMAEKMLLNPDYPILPKGPPVDTIPVDILAEGIARLMEHPPARNRVYHLMQGLEDGMEFSEFIDKLQPIAEDHLQRAIRRPAYVIPVFHRLLIEITRAVTWGRARRAARIQLLFIRYAGVSWKVESRQTRAALASAGVKWPRFDEYLPNLMAYYFKHRHEKRLPF
jgi:thioester reductase-like protein